MSKEKLIIETVTVVGMLVAMAGLVAHCGSPPPALAPVMTDQGRLAMRELAYQGCIWKAKQNYGVGPQALAAANTCFDIVDQTFAGADVAGPLFSDAGLGLEAGHD